MPLGLTAFVIYLLLIVVLYGVVKRNIGESMFWAFLGICLFGGANFFALFWGGVTFAAKSSVVYAATAFVFAAYLVDKSGLMEKLILVLSSLLGRFRGSAAYVDTVASAFMGMVSGSGSGNAASTGAITIPWMVRSGWPREAAATIVAGNSGLGIALPPSSSMFILMGSAPLLPLVAGNEGSIYLAVLGVGLWTVLMRVIIVFWYARHLGVQPVPSEMRPPFSQAIRQGWSSLLVLLAVLIPVFVVMVGPLSAGLKASLGKSFDSVDEIIWMPTLLVLITALVGWRGIASAAREAGGFVSLVNASAHRYAIVGATLFFAAAASQPLGKLGFSRDVASLLELGNIPAIGMLAVVGLFIMLAAGPLTSTATITAIGPVAALALISAGFNPSLAIALTLLFASTEGASPPNAAPIFIASSLADVDPGRTFVPLMKYFVAPTFLVALLIGLGVLPILG